MIHHLSLRSHRPCRPVPLGADFTGTAPDGAALSVNSYYFEKNGKPFFPVSGEFHYSRMDPRRWEDEIIKTRMGGVNTVSTYLFWNHIEEKEGVFDFTGRRDLRSFIRLCAKHGLYVILRVGPFAHGEARNGGLPDWLYGKPFEVRTTHPDFLFYVRRLYRRIGEEAAGLFFRDGGPVIAVQLDNEYMHAGAVWEMTCGVSDEWVYAGGEGENYILKLREIALDCGLAPVFFTTTAWGGAACSDRTLPLWGGYAYRPWLFYSRRGEHPATEEYVYEDYHHNGKRCADDFKPAYLPESRPYACCEMMGGMMCSYNYRFIFPCKSVDALANIKIASGCNFIGYYMFHGGTNPQSSSGVYLNESQVSRISYDYQAALGEFGQIRGSYRRLKCIHYFTRSFSALLAPMETVLPPGASEISPDDTGTLRFAVRTDGKSGFLFINNFQDHRAMTEKKHETVRLETADKTLEFDVCIAPDENAVLPFNFDMDGILLRQANAQPVLRTVAGGRVTYVFLVPDGMDGRFFFEDGAEVTGENGFFTVSKGTFSADVITVSREEADRLFLLRDGSIVFTDAALLEDEKGDLRLETEQAENLILCYPPDRLGAHGAKRLEDRGRLGVYLASVTEKRILPEVRPAAPCRWTVKLPENALDGLKDARLQIDYRGDIGTLFLCGTMISDNFCNGAPWEVGLMEQQGRLSEPMVLKIAPLRKGARVSVESAMAARSEEVQSALAELTGIHVRPVYEIRL